MKQCFIGTSKFGFAVMIRLATLFIMTFVTASLSSAEAEEFEQSGIVERLTFFGVGGLGSAETLFYLIETKNLVAACGPVAAIPDASFRIGAPPAADKAIKVYVLLNNTILNAYVRRVPVSVTYTCGSNLPEVSSAR